MLLKGAVCMTTSANKKVPLTRGMSVRMQSTGIFYKVVGMLKPLTGFELNSETGEVHENAETGEP